MVKCTGLYYLAFLSIFQITDADITFAVTAEYLTQLNPNIFDATPKLKALNERIYSIPSIAKHMEQRPKTG